jgi:hypothetical protein
MISNLHVTFRAVRFALLMMLPVTAQCFYNPSTGRWLARDPVDEIGSINRLSPELRRLLSLSRPTKEGVYLFVGNSPLDARDLVGFQTQRPCQCGLDVTAPLAQTLQTVDRSFRQLGFTDKCRLCGRLLDATPEDESERWTTDPRRMKAAFAWDIQELKTIGFSWQFGTEPPPFFDGTPPCQRTVTISGGCYYASGVNFALWGKMFSLCDTVWIYGNMYSLGNAQSLARTWKYRVYGSSVEADQAVQFTAYGYNGSQPGSSLSRCSPNGTLWPGPFHWFWRPVFYPPRAN